MLCGITQFLAAVLQVSEVFRHLWNAYAISQVSALASLVTSPLLPPFAMESKSRVELHAAFSVLIASIRLLFTALAFVAARPVRLGRLSIDLVI